MEEDKNVEEVSQKEESTPKESLRESIERNFKESSDKAPDDYDGSPKEPAKGKSFVNNEVVQEQSKEVINAPADMSPEEKANWNKYDVQTQKYLARRALDVRKQITEAHTLKQTYAEFDRIITPDVRDEYARLKTSVPQVVENAVAWDRAFKTGDKKAVLAEYAKAQGIDLNEFFHSYQSGTIGQEPEPQYMTKEEFEREYQERRQKESLEQQQISIVTEQQTALESFLSNPFFQDPETTEQKQLAIAREVRILQEIEGFSGSPKEVLDKALERCIATNEYFSSIRQVQPPAASTSVNEQMQRVRDAKKSRSISGSLGSGSPVQKSSSLRESLERNWAKS